MKKAELTKWLDKLVKATKQFTDIGDFSYEITKCHMNQRTNKNIPYVQLGSGIREVAKVMGLEVVVDYETEDGTCYKFNYKDVDFIEYDPKED